MAVDSVGKSEAQTSAQRRQIEEERKRDIDKLEKTRKEQLNNLTEAKDRELERVYENQITQIEDSRSNADYKVERAKRQADAQVQAFEHETSQLTDQAHKKFQEKAHTLQKTVENMDEQRALMLKHHSDSMRKLKEQRDQHAYDTNHKIQQDTAKVYADRERQLVELNRKMDADIASRRVEGNARKEAVSREAKMEVESILRERDMKSNSLTKEISHQELEAREQMDRKRADFQSLEQMQQLDYEDRVADLTREAKRQVNNTHAVGKRKLFEAREHYEQEDTQLQKQHAQASTKARLSHDLTMAQIESDARTQEDISKKAFNMKHDAYTKQREEILSQNSKKNAEFQKKVAEDFAKQSKNTQESRKQAISNQEKMMADDIHNARHQGDQQLNAAIKKNIVAVANHDYKANDPFYRVHALNTQVTDNEQEVVLRVKVPEHEQEAVRLAMNDGALSISASRRHQEKAVEEDGRKVASNAYQSYSESFPVKGKLEIKRMTKSYDGGMLTFRIPKG